MAWITRPSAVYGASFGRPTTLVVPPSYDPNVQYTLGLLMHHYGSNGGQAPGRLDLTNSPQYDDGMMYFAPTGLLDNFNEPYWVYWNAPSPGDDFDYIINGLIKPALADWNIDPKRVFAFGYSNGALFNSRLVEFYSDVIRAVIGYSGPTSPNSAPVDPPQTPIPHAVPSVNYGSPIDSVVLYGGGNGSTLPGGLAGHPFQGEVDCAATHAAWNGVAGTLQPAYDTIRMVSLPAGNNVQRQAYDGTTPQTAVELWTAIPSGGEPTHDLSLVPGIGQLTFKWCLDNHNDF